MKKIVLAIGLACSLLAAPLFSASAVNAETAQTQERIAKIPMQPISKNQMQQQAEPDVKPVRDLAPDELKNLRKMDPFTSVSSYGEITSITEQKEYISKNRVPHLDGSSEAKSSLVTINSVINGDNRTKVTDTTEFPYRAIALVETRHPSGVYYQCTGFFIDDNTVATAGHCIYDTYQNKWFTEAYVYPAFDGNNYPYVGTTSSHFQVSTSWINVNPPAPNEIYLSDIPKDYGVIKVKNGFANDYGIGYFAIRTSDHAVGEQVNVTGYPYDKDGAMWKALGYVKALDTYRIDHDADAVSGNSGSPIFNSKNGVLAAIGVNNAESSSMNYGARIIGYTYDNLRYWSSLSY